MRAVVLHEHGSNDQLVFDARYRDPVPDAGEVVLRVRACSLNYHDIFTRRGMPGIKVPLPIVIGIDVAGEVVDLGAGVTGFERGDRVLVDPIDRERGRLLGEAFDGGLAEYVRVPAHMLIPLDDAIGFAEAASLPTAYGTAYRMMVTRGRIQSGEKVLILGASGGVGTCCVQLAKLAGATVVACASSPQKLARLSELGADIGIDYAATDWVAECHRQFGRARLDPRKAGGLDVVINFTGGDTWVKSLQVLRKDGRMLTCGATAGYDPPEDIRFIWTFELNIIGSNGWSRDDVLALLQMLKDGRLKPVLHPERFPLERARDAMQALESRAFYGKIIVEP
ncbi:MAG TPA: zinc-binding dehydrogenase [Burkholderiaceae bacterium]|nr:zinc-binding dehydrogenase [Burkholderiaceae bacterium]